MKSLSSLLIFILLLFSNNTFSQEDQKELKHGLQFQIGTLLDLRSFNNYTFSYRYLFNENSGLRIGLLTNVNKDDYDVTQQIDTISNKPEIFSENYNFKISAQYLKSIINYNKFDLIIGGGPFISYRKIHAKSEYIMSSYISEIEENSKVLGFGLDIVLGVEYKLASNVILSGEYALTIVQENSEINNSQRAVYHDGRQDSIRKEEGTRNSFRTNGLGVNLGLSVYF